MKFFLEINSLMEKNLLKIESLRVEKKAALLEKKLTTYLKKFIKENPPTSISPKIIKTYIHLVSEKELEVSWARFSYEERAIYIDLYLSRKYFKDIKNRTLSISDASHHIADIFGHELCHYLQMKSRNLGIELFFGFDNFSSDTSMLKGSMEQKYISSKIELSAYAANAAYELLYNTYYDIDYVINSLRTKKGILALRKNSQSIDRFYHRIRNSKQENAKNVWNLFLTKVYKNLKDLYMRYIELIEKDLFGVNTPSLEQIAKKHNVDLDILKKELAMGIEIEKEHTLDTSLANEIARDHLNEFPDYYTRLKKMEQK